MEKARIIVYDDWGVMLDETETFFKDKETEVEEIEVECNGKIYKYLGGELVNTQRGFIPAQDLTEEDTIIE